MKAISEPENGLRSLYLLSEYNTEDNNVVKALYEPCLSKSIKYDRAVGYFRSNIYNELGEQLLDFAIKGGKIRLVCSPDIPEADELAAREGYTVRNDNLISDAKLLIIELMKKMSRNPEELDCLEMLRLLIINSSLDLYVALRTGGIYHRKVGRFYDEYGNYVVFSGSGNETQKAVSLPERWGNDEEFDVFRSWGESFEKMKAEKKSYYLDQLFSGGTKSTKITLINDVTIETLNKFRKYRNLEECRMGARKRSSAQSKQNEKKLYYYQKQAIKSWEDAGRVGIISMATGTGKTLTSLHAIKPLLFMGLPILILVPTKEIMDQWEIDIRNEFSNVPILLAGGGHDWKGVNSKRMYVSDLSEPRIILSTMDTASTSDFIEFISQAINLVLVADEVHRLGSIGRRSVLKLKFAAKLGLSATPERLFDDDGNKVIADAFGEYPVFNLPINAKVRMSEDSEEEVDILGKFLSKYYYDFQTVTLNEIEQKKWDSLTSRIKNYMAKIQSSESEIKLEKFDNATIKLLLIERARIIKSAQEKVNAAERIISKSYPSEGRWLVYCDNHDQMNAVWSRLKQINPDIPIMRYYSEMSYDERRRVLDSFEESPGIVVSIKCLDEGVNIPLADGAVILASSSNPREYIQRRGRVLRKHVGKGDVHIIDTIVLPSSTTDYSPFSIVRGEISRAYSFASSAINKDITHRLWRIVQKYNAFEGKDSYFSLGEEAE
jgi:superfamily II DNA or RNA helicase